MTRWLVDASNVIGSRPDGWWRDREGATSRLLDALRDFARGEDEVVVVLDAGPAEWAGRDGGFEVAIAPRRAGGGTRPMTRSRGLLRRTLIRGPCAW